MIIQIRGTSGSGKSTLVRAVMDLYPEKTTLHGRPVPDKPRKQPVGYYFNRDPAFGLFVPGHYETPCGGADTITQMDYTVGLIREHATKGADVLFEGLLFSADVNKVASLVGADTSPVHAIVLAPTLDECLESVNERRRAKRGDDAPGVNPKNTASKHKGVMSTIPRLEAAGIKVHVFKDAPVQLIRSKALAKVRELLDV